MNDDGGHAVMHPSGYMPLKIVNRFMCFWHAIFFTKIPVIINDVHLVII